VEANGNSETGINPFVSNLSILNIFFSLSLTVFSFGIVIYLENNAISVLYAGVGLTLGQIILLGTSVLQGRAIDKGYSFQLMVTGSILYGAVLFLIYFTVSIGYIPSLLIIAFIPLMLVFEGVFRSSLNAFIAKAAAARVLGKNYSRILTSEAIGSALAYVVMVYGAFSLSLSLVFVSSSILLVFIALLSFFFLRSRERDIMRKAESSVRRPGFRESIRNLSSKKNFAIPLITSKAFMTIGIIGFTFFYVPTGVYLGISPEYSFTFLLITYLLAILIGKYGEKVLDRHQGFGRGFVSLNMMFDVITYGLVVLSIIYRVDYLFLIAALFASPGVLLVSGAMTYEVGVIGRESRGMFGGVQRQFIGIISAFVSFPLTYIFTRNPSYMWGIIFAASLISFIITFTIPSAFPSTGAVPVN